MTKRTLIASIPAIAATCLVLMWLGAMFDSLSHSIWGGLIVITLSLPVAGSLAALLALDAISAYGVRWKLADDWHHLFHESTQGALLIAVLGLPWLIIVVSFGAGGLLALYGGGGSFLFPLNVLAKIPIVGQHLAAFPALFMVLVFLGLSMYVAYTSVRAIVRLIRTPRTGYVQGGVPLASQEAEREEAAGGGEFGAWESNRG